MDISVYIYIYLYVYIYVNVCIFFSYIYFKQVLTFILSLHPYWKTAFYNVDDRLACLKKVDLFLSLAHGSHIRMTTAFKQKFLREAYEKDENLVSTTRQIDKSHSCKARCRTPLPWERMTVKFGQGDVEASNRSLHNILNRVLRKLTCRSFSANFSTCFKLVPQESSIFVSKFASHVIKVTRTDKNIVGADLLVTPQKPCNSSLLSYLQVPPSRKQFRLKFVTIF